MPSSDDSFASCALSCEISREASHAASLPPSPRVARGNSCMEPSYFPLPFHSTPIGIGHNFPLRRSLP